jgi:mercuric ion binding protein
MKHPILLLTLVTLFAAPAWAAPKTATLSVPGMTCAACPITVKTALNKTPGVSQTKVNYEKRQATVVFDDAKTNTAALTRATADAGFPSQVVGVSP